jgi:vitamin B12 transport system substrate-binding protein
MKHSLLLISIFIFSYSAQSREIKRIVTLAPHATEIAWAAGLGDKLVGVSERSDYPSQVTSLPKVSNYKGINIEKVLALKPDLVIAWPDGNPQKELDKLKAMGVNIYYSKTRRLEDIGENIATLSQYADDPTKGLEAAKDFRSKLHTWRTRYQDKASVRYFYQLSEKPIITVGQDRWPSEVFRLCGGVNVFENSAAPYPQVSLEQVIIAKPDVIFYSRHAIDHPTQWQSWKEIPAVANDAIWILNSDWLNRPTPRTLLAIEQICGYLDKVRESR